MSRAFKIEEHGTVGVAGRSLEGQVFSTCMFEKICEERGRNMVKNNDNSKY